MHVQQRLLKEEWPMRLGEHPAARVVTAGHLEDDPTNRQTIFNGLRVRMAVNTGRLLKSYAAIYSNSNHL